MGKLSRFINLAKRALDDDAGQGRRHGTDAQQSRAADPARWPVAPDREGRAAVARYAYLLRTAPPEQLEQLHREAFERLTPAEREELRSTLAQGDPLYGAAPTSSPRDLAVAATRVQSARPGTLQRLLGRSGTRGRRITPGKAAGLAAGGLLLSVATGAVVTTVGGSLLQAAEGLGVDFGALAEGLDPAAFGLDSLGDLGLDSLSEGLGGAGETVSGIGESLGQAVGDFKLPNLGDLFGR